MTWGKINKALSHGYRITNLQDAEDISKISNNVIANLHDLRKDIDAAKAAKVEVEQKLNSERKAHEIQMQEMEEHVLELTLKGQGKDGEIEALDEAVNKFAEGWIALDKVRRARGKKGGKAAGQRLGSPGNSPELPSGGF